jgi:antitoxin ParD1/3/4
MQAVYAEKLSISLPPTLLDFVEEYRVARGIKSRSQVIEDALYVLRERELEFAYKEASAEVDPAWESTVADGLDDEAW